MLNIIIFGPPGVGKGTQGEKIIEKYKLTPIATGELFRRHLSEGTELGRLAQTFMDHGNLVPDEIVIGMVDEKIKEEKDAVGFIFDGFPRTVPQAEALDQLLEANGSPLVGTIALTAPDEELTARILERGKSSGRTDDQSKEKVANRIRVYNEETLPVAEYYASKGLLVNLYGVGGIEPIFEEICKVIDSYEVSSK